MKRISKFMALLLAALLLVGSFSVAYADDIPIGGYVYEDYGSCGPNLTWRFKSYKYPNGQIAPGEMTIKGTGAMTSYYDSNLPQWARLKEAIGSLTVENGVLSIGSFAFADCDHLENVTLPDSLRRIENNAFEDCNALNTVTMPAKITEIGDSAFSNCSSLRNAILPANLNTLGKYAFFKCYSLEGELIVPGGVKTVPDFAFFDCWSMTNVVLKEGVVTVGNSAFSNCSRMREISLPDSLHYLDACAFANCYALRSVALPPNLISIPEECFANCTNLSEVSMHKSVTLIEKGAFNNCPITTVVYYGQSTEWEKVVVLDFNDGLVGANYAFRPITTDEVDTCDYCGKVHPNTFLGRLTKAFHKVLLFLRKLITLLGKLGTFLGII